MPASTSLYTEFQAYRGEILKHKWIESEKEGRDIGFEQALIEWTTRYRSEWRSSRPVGIREELPTSSELSE